MENTLGKRSMFKRLLISCIAVFIIPFVTILLIYNSANTMIGDEIIQANRNSLHLFINSLDNTLTEAATLANQLTQSSMFRSFASRGKLESPTKSTEVYNLKRYLQASKNASFEDVFVYFPDNNLIVSQNHGCLNTATFWQAYYTHLFDSSEAFADFLATDARARVTYVRCEGADTSTVAAVYQNAYAGGGLFTVYVMMDPMTLRQQAEAAIGESAGMLMLYSQQEDFLFSAGAENLQLDLAGLRETEDYTTIELDGKTYILQLYQAKATGCVYISAIPTQVFWQRMNRLRTISLVSILLCLGCTVALALMLTRRNYRPINNLVLTAAERSGLSYEKDDIGELEFLAHVLDTSMVRGDLLATRLSQVNNTLIENFLLRAMQGTMYNEETQEDVFILNGIQLLSDAFSVVLLRAETQEAAQPVDGIQMDAFFRERLYALCGRAHQGLIVQLDAVSYALIINYADAHDTGRFACVADSLCRTFSEECEGRLGIKCTIAISNIHHGLSGIHTAYNEAALALKYRFLRGKGSINRASDSRGGMQGSLLNDMTSQQMILQAVKDEDIAIGPTLSQALLDAAHIDQFALLEAVECYRYDVINIVRKLTLEMNAVRQGRENHYIGALFQADTLDSFQERLMEALSQLRAFHQNAQLQDNVCAQAMRLIEREYTDGELNNNIIADRLGITSGYLSKLFRMQYDMSMTACLYKLRIKHAKSLLLETQQSIDEIAGQVGFVSASALIKTFKKYEGITPGVYRRLNARPEA